MLRLTASDGELSSSAKTTVTVNAANSQADLRVAELAVSATQGGNRPRELYDCESAQG